MNAVEGVRGSIVCDSRGEVIVSAMPAAFQAAQLVDIGREVTQTMAGLGIADRAVTGLDFVYHGARLVAHDLANAVLIILCGPRVKIALLRLTLKVVTSRWKSDREIQVLLEDRAVKREVVQDHVDETSWHLLQALRGKGVSDA